MTTGSTEAEQAAMLVCGPAIALWLILEPTALAMSLARRAWEWAGKYKRN